MDNEVKKALISLIRSWTPLDELGVTHLIGEWTKAAVEVQRAARAVEDAAKAAADKDRA